MCRPTRSPRALRTDLAQRRRRCPAVAIAASHTTTPTMLGPSKSLRSVSACRTTPRGGRTGRPTICSLRFHELIDRSRIPGSGVAAAAARSDHPIDLYRRGECNPEFTRSLGDSAGCGVGQAADAARPYLRWAACLDTPSISDFGPGPLSVGRATTASRRSLSSVARFSASSATWRSACQRVRAPPPTHARPIFEHRGLLGSRFLGHGVHQPFRNFARAGMPWMTAYAILVIHDADLERRAVAEDR